MSYYNLDGESPAVKQPKGLKIKLRPHQLTSIAAMRELEDQSQIIIDKPDMNSGIYQSLRYKLTDINELASSTFVVETNSAILADKVGSGKTYMMIGLILCKQVPAAHNRFVMGTDHFSIKMISVKETEHVNLIVVPHGLINQWAEFMNKSNLSSVKLDGTGDFDIFFDVSYVDKKDPLQNGLVTYKQTKKKQLPKAVTKKKKSGSKTNKKPDNKIIFEKRVLNPKKVADVLQNTQVFILNVNRYRYFKQIFRTNKWSRVIIDEMDTANIPSIFDEFGNFNWFLTATPTAIHKTCKRYVNKIFGYSPHLLNYFVVKNKDEYVDQSVVLPRPDVFMIETQLQKIVLAIKNLIPSDVMQLINAGNMKEAIAKLNCDVDTEENIVKVLTNKIDTELHNLNAELAYVKAIVPKDKKKIKKIKADMARCNTKLETINERINSIKDECCFICADTFDTPTILDCCKSVFCFKCLLEALRIADGKCPYCRHVIKSNKEYHIIAAKPIKPVKNVKPEKRVGKLYNKMDKSDVLEEILTYISANDDTPRILIFSDYAQTFDKIVKNITKAKLEYALISGTPAHITNTISDFNAGITNILLLDSHHYGSGLNLQSANYLILYHRMMPELETQVIGRAHRFGRKTPVKIIYMVNDTESKNTNMSTNPHIITGSDELWMITDTPRNDKDIGPELYIDSDNENENDSDIDITDLTLNDLDDMMSEEEDEVVVPKKVITKKPDFQRKSEPVKKIPQRTLKKKIPKRTINKKKVISDEEN